MVGQKVQPLHRPTENLLGEWMNIQGHRLRGKKKVSNPFSSRMQTERIEIEKRWVEKCLITGHS